MVTVTPSASTATETVTLVESAADTILFTETTTETASTETVVITEATTTTAFTETATNFEVTVTEPFTVTNVETLPATTTTSFQYENILTVKLKARETETPSLPDYASGVCEDWNKYVKACKCAGVEVTTVTASAGPVETVTVTASGAVTTTVATLSTTETEVISVTATVSDTQIDTISHTATVTEEGVVTVTVSTTVEATQTPTSVVPLACKATGIPFRASNPFPDGSVRWMNSVNNNLVAWQSFPGGTAPTSQQSANWVLDPEGYLEHSGPVPGLAASLVAYYDLSRTSATVQVLVKPKNEVQAGVADGRWGRVKGCVSAATSTLNLAVGGVPGGRHNILSCGNGLYISAGAGTDIRPDCVALTPQAI